MKVSATSYLIIGSGRLAHHLEIYFQHLKLSFCRWSRQSSSLDQLTSSLNDCSHVLLAVNDNAIAEVYQLCKDLAPTASPVFIHFSGAQQITGVIAAHPLMTFTSEPPTHSTSEPDLEWYKRIPFIIDQGFDMQTILPGLPNPHWSLAPSQRGLYHALCSLAGNATYLLWQSIGSEMAKLGLPRQILEPFLHQTVENAIQKSGSNLTGPLARGDWQVVQRHLVELQNNPALELFYRAYLQLAEHHGYQIPKNLPLDISYERPKEVL